MFSGYQLNLSNSLKNTFTKAERLKSKRIIDLLFNDGKVIAFHPVKLIWSEVELPVGQAIQFGVSVPKRRFKLAVDRNAIKRKMREVIRLNKHSLVDTIGMKEKQLALMILYTGNKMPEYSLLHKKITAAFNRLNEIA